MRLSCGTAGVSTESGQLPPAGAWPWKLRECPGRRLRHGQGCKRNACTERAPALLVLGGGVACMLHRLRGPRGGNHGLHGAAGRRPRYAVIVPEVEARVEDKARGRCEAWLGEGAQEVVSRQDDAGAEIASKIRASATQLELGLVERATEVRVLLLAALCGEHVLMMGPPGTAKSKLARRLASFGGPGAVFFERLLTRFTVPEELFGPLSLKGLERDEYVRQTKGFLPEATVAFVDEIFKANSAILNTLLSVINERVFDNGAGRVPVPLRCLVAASNEPPESDELNALYDRFLFRLDVQPVSDGGLEALVAAATGPTALIEPPEQLPLGMADAVAVQRAAAAVAVPTEVVGVLRVVRRLLGAQDPPSLVSDRRLGQVARMLQVAAWSCGRQSVERADCFLLRHVLWNAPEERKALESGLVDCLIGGKRRQVAAVLSGFLDRVERAGARADAQDGPAQLRRELAAFRAVLVREVSGILRQQQLLQEHCWLAPQEAQQLCATVEARLDDAASCGPRALLAEVAKLDAAAEQSSLAAYVTSRRARGELRWKQVVEARSDAEQGTADEDEADETFDVGKHKGRRFSEVAASDEDYCRMVERKCAEGQFAKATTLDRQIRAFVAYLRGDRGRAARGLPASS